MLEYNKVEKEQERIFNEYDRVFDTENKGLWTEIVFFKFVKKINANKYLVEVSPFFYRDNLKSGLKVGDQIKIKPMDINFLNPMDKVIEKHRQTHFSQIHINLPYVTDWGGSPYRNRNTAVNLLELYDIVRIQVKIENIKENKQWGFCWYLQILKYDSKKEWFLGLALNTYKILEENYDYEEPMKVDCLYYFHKNSISEIPIWEDNHNYKKLEKEIKRDLSREITGYVNSANDTEFRADMNKILTKLI